jgi:hypothetical protein
MRVLLLASSLVVANGAVFAQNSSSTQSQKLYFEYLDACMTDWDAATHMTKEELRHTCQRVANERAKFRLSKMKAGSPSKGSAIKRAVVIRTACHSCGM